MRYSIIIPAINEEAAFKDLLPSLGKFKGDCEIIIADGGSSDATKAAAQEFDCRVVDSAKGRGVQCNTGAQEAKGEILIFLHADSRFSPQCFEQIVSHFRDEKNRIAKFRMQFNHSHWVFKLSGFFTRFDGIFLSFGDQGIIIRKKFFDELGGFPDWPLFEDVELFKKARQRTKIHTLKGPIITCARKFLKNGIIRQQLNNGLLIIRYLLGETPQKLAGRYYK